MATEGCVKTRQKTSLKFQPCSQVTETHRIAVIFHKSLGSFLQGWEYNIYMKERGNSRRTNTLCILVVRRTWRDRYSKRGWVRTALINKSSQFTYDSLSNKQVCGDDLFDKLRRSCLMVPINEPLVRWRHPSKTLKTPFHNHWSYFRWCHE